jgi:glycosyltransferase involved in cell wall biosynthesis
MNVIHSIASLNLEAGGPSRSIPELCSAINMLGGSAEIVTQRWPGKEVIPNHNNLKIHFAENTKYWNPVRSSVVNVLSEKNTSDGISIIHAHGIWLKNIHYSIKFAVANGIPLVLSPRGMLQPWAKEHKAIKKRIAWLLYQYKDLKKVFAFHATSESEYESIRRNGFDQPVAIIPNGVNKLLVSQQAMPDKKKKTVLFLSRIDVVKGLPLLLEAWSQLKNDNWELVIAGNDYGNHKSDMMAYANILGISDSVKFLGPTYGADKELVFQTSNVFILPSYSENFGIVVAEALQYGLPVITTKGTPWSELVEHHCGWWIENTTQELLKALQDATCLSDQERNEMGERGRALIEEKYLWPAIAGKMLNFYEWLLQDGTKPDFVV